MKKILIVITLLIVTVVFCQYVFAGTVFKAIISKFSVKATLKPVSVCKENCLIEIDETDKKLMPEQTPLMLIRHADGTGELVPVTNK